MKVIGLTGGIASGKSTVSNMAMMYSIKVIDADRIAREIVAKGKPALAQIIKFFGNEVVNEKGELDRKVLGKIVFNDREKLEKLNSITHPVIIKEIEKKIQEYRKVRDFSAIILDAALLIETDMRKLVDEVWLVIVDEKIQINRLIQRDGISKNEALRRIRSQMPTSEKIKYADVIIENNGDLVELATKVKKLLDKNIGR